MHQGAYARGCGAWLTSRTASARRLTCTCTPSGPPAARLQRRCSYRPHGPPGEASGFVATECVRNPVNSVNWGFLQACATDLPFFTCSAAPFEPSEASLSNFNWPPPELDEEPQSAPVARCSSDRLSEAVRPAAGRRSRRCFFVAAAAVMR